MYTGDQVHSISPITPSELLIALHNIDCKEDEALMKAVIKGGYVCGSFSHYLYLFYTRPKAHKNSYTLLSSVTTNYRY